MNKQTKANNQNAEVFLMFVVKYNYLLSNSADFMEDSKENNCAIGIYVTFSSVVSSFPCWLRWSFILSFWPSFPALERVFSLPLFTRSSVTFLQEELKTLSSEADGEAFNGISLFIIFAKINVLSLQRLSPRQQSPGTPVVTSSTSF